MYPADLKYTKDHEWIKLDGKLGRIGVTDYAQHALGDVVFVELPQVSRALQAMETFGVVESVKAVSDIYAPADGEVIAVNKDVVGSPELVNSDPYGAGWLVRVRLTDPASLDALMDRAAYVAYLAGLDQG